MVVVAILAIGLTSYLTYVHYSGIEPVCTAGQSCIKVQTSTWSKLDGVPVALIGLLGYIGILASLLLPDREETRLATLGLTLIGFGFSAYLTYREIFSIKAICEECVSSFVLVAILLSCAVVRYLRSPSGVHNVANINFSNRLLAAPARAVILPYEMSVGAAHASAPSPQDRLKIADVAIFYGERSGGIHTYFEAKAAFARRTGVVRAPSSGPGPSHRRRGRTVTSNAPSPRRLERVPPPARQRRAPGHPRRAEPHVVMLHDPFWTPRLVSRAAHEVGGHVSPSTIRPLRSTPPDSGTAPRVPEALRRWYRRAYCEVDAVMSVVDTDIDSRRPSTLSLRLGLDPAFRPRPAIARVDHVLYAGGCAARRACVNSSKRPPPHASHGPS